MKTKYQRMTKEERKQAIADYNKRAPQVFKKYKKLKNVCIFGIIYSVIALIIDIILNDKVMFKSFNANILIDCGLLLFCIFFFIFAKNRMDYLVNNMLVEDLRQKQIEKWRKEKDELSKPKKIKTTKRSTTKKKSTSKKTTKKNK